MWAEEQGCRSAFSGVEVLAAPSLSGAFSDPGGRPGQGGGQHLPGNHGPRSPRTLFLVRFSIIAVNCRVWSSCCASIELVTCDKAASMPPSAHPARSHFVAAAALEAWLVPSDACRGYVCVLPGGCHLFFPGPGLRLSPVLEL